MSSIDDVVPDPRWIVPAAPGWIARFVWVDEDDDVHVERFPIVGWLDDASCEGGPVVWNEPERELCPLSEIPFANGMVDAVYFDPACLPSEPELRPEAVRIELAKRKEAAANRRAAQRAAA
jgi:hypothetical protein